MAASAGAFLLLLTARSYAGVLLTTGFFILCKTLIRPALASLMSKRTTIGHGAIQGLNNSFMSLGRIVGPLWAGFAFDVDVDYPYLSGAVLMLIGFAVSARWISQGARRRGEPASQEAAGTLK